MYSCAMAKSTDEQVATLTRAFATRLQDRLRRAERAGIDLASALDDPDALADRMIAALPLGDPFDALIGPFYDMQGVIGFVGITKTAVVKRVRTGRLIGCQLADASRTWVFPTWQFGPDAALIDGMADVWAELAVHADPWTAAAWMCSPNRGLDDETPVGWLTDGRRPEEVVDAARRAAARWGA